MNNIYDSIRVLFLRIVYMIVPTTLLLIALFVFGPATRNLINNLRIIEFLATVGLVFVLILIVYFIFEFLLFFAKAKVADWRFEERARVCIGQIIYVTTLTTNSSPLCQNLFSAFLCFSSSGRYASFFDFNLGKI